MLRPAQWMFLLSVGATAASGAENPASKQKPTVLPEVKVSAEVPIVKVGDYPLLEKRYGAAAVAHGDFVYTIGGARGDVVIDTIERFNVRTGKSEPFGRLKQARCWHGAAVVGDRVYVIGGVTRHDAFRGPTASVEIYDLRTGERSAGPNLPRGRERFACVTLGKGICVIGGRWLKGTYLERAYDPQDGGSNESIQQTRVFAYTNTVAILDPATGRWSDGPPMPAACHAAAVVVAGSSIVVAGGFDGAQVRGDDNFDDTFASLNQVVAWNPRDGVWRTQPSLHRRAGKHSLAFLGQHLFLFGPRDAEGEFIAYDLKTKESESFTLDYKRAHDTAAVVHEEKIYVIGGRGKHENPIDYIQVFALRKPAAAKPATTSE